MFLMSEGWTHWETLQRGNSGSAMRRAGDPPPGSGRGHRERALRGCPQRGGKTCDYSLYYLSMKERGKLALTWEGREEEANRKGESRERATKEGTGSGEGES